MRLRIFGKSLIWWVILISPLILRSSIFDKIHPIKQYEGEAILEGNFSMSCVWRSFSTVLGELTVSQISSLTDETKYRYNDQESSNADDLQLKC